MQYENFVSLIQTLEHEWLQFLLRKKTHACTFHVGRVCKRWTSAQQENKSLNHLPVFRRRLGRLTLDVSNEYLRIKMRDQDQESGSGIKGQGQASGSMIRDSHKIGNSRGSLQVHVYWTSIGILWDVWNLPPLVGTRVRTPVAKIWLQHKETDKVLTNVHEQVLF